MRRISITLVIAIGMMILATALPMCPNAGQCTVNIQTLDVCHGSAPGINLDTPYSIDECCCLLHPQLIDVWKISDSPFKPLLISFQDERPPRF
jgi:hypothetical protein